MIERRQHFEPVAPIPFAPVTNNCKWVRRDSFPHAYMVAMGWELLLEDGDGMLFRAPHDFDNTGVRAL